MPNRLLISPAELGRANTGLRLNKYVDRENPEFALIAQRKVDSAYEMAFRRWEAYWRKREEECVLCKGRVITRMIVGLGDENVTENGIRLSTTYGTPIIPGSSVKGVLRARISDTDGRLRDFLFGGEDGDGDAGYASLQDAWWIPESQSAFKVDVLTPHHTGYYSGDGNRPPSELDSPTPVPFLTVRGSFLFVAEFLSDDPDGQWKRFFRDLMVGALERDGVGAKRSSGYGRFQF
jgi:CRISPR-associated protein Cmr6